MSKTNRFTETSSENTLAQNILLFHLVTNEDIIANYTEQAEYYVVENPISVAVSREGVAIIPWIPYSDSRSFIINKNQVITTGEPHADLMTKYCELTGKIVVPKSNIIIH